VDETYIGAQWNYKRHRAKAAGSKRGKRCSKTPVFGILYRGGKVWAQAVSDVEARMLLPLLSRRVELGSTICSIAEKTRPELWLIAIVHGLVKYNPGEYSHGQGNHINGREGFWAYLPRRLAAKGGLSQERLALYLAEYVWRYNHRNDRIQ